MKKIVLDLSKEELMYMEGISLIVRRYMREVMPDKKTGPSNGVVFKLDSDSSVKECLIIRIYHTRTQVLVHARINVMVEDTPEAQAEHFGTRDIRN